MDLDAHSGRSTARVVEIGRARPDAAMMEISPVSVEQQDARGRLGQGSGGRPRDCPEPRDRGGEPSRRSQGVTSRQRPGKAAEAREVALADLAVNALTSSTTWLRAKSA